jgi:hypothetical protein
MEAIKKDAWSLQYAPDMFKNNKDTVLEALKEIGYALKFVSEEMKKDR